MDIRLLGLCILWCMGIPALILAAGAGRRLGEAGRPKVLAEVAGVPLLVRLLRQLIELDMSPITIAVGAYAGQVRDVVGALRLPEPPVFVENAEYATTNNSYTLHLCADRLLQGGLLIEGDVVADTIVLEQVLAAAAPDVWAVRSPGDIRDGAFLRADPEGTLSALQIVAADEGPPEGYKSTGILKLSPQLGARLCGWLAQEVSVRRDRYYDLVLADHLTEAAMKLLVVDRGRWIEVDSPRDLALARVVFESAR